ncbi:Protein HUM-9 [Aphelenchoides avenae]|nr:Protein HUM-9 [Aphelenchus avenae]
MQDRLNTVDSTLHQERSLRHEYESEVEELEEEVERLKEELDRCTVQKDAMKEQNRVKDTTIRKLERKLDDKTAEMDACVNELKKMHRTAQQELREKFEELKRKFTKLELESKQQRCKLETAFERESSVDSDYGRTATLSRYGSRLSVNSMNSSTMSLSSSGRALGIHRRETEPELHGIRHYEPPTPYSSHSMPRSPSKASLSRNATLSNINQSSLDVSGNLARSPSSSQLHASERKVAQLERELQSSKTDNQLLKREIEVYKTSLQELERSKDTLAKQVRTLSAELEKNKKDLHDEQIKCQTMELSLRKANSDLNTMKHKLENAFAEGKDDLVAERKKHAAKIEQLQNEHEMKIQQFLSQNRNREHLQGELAETRAQLDRALAQIAQLERMQKSQTTIGETWESQYRNAIQEMEGLRDENAALKSKIRRQYKQIELLTRESQPYRVQDGIV